MREDLGVPWALSVLSRHLSSSLTPPEGAMKKTLSTSSMNATSNGVNTLTTIKANAINKSQ